MLEIGTEIRGYRIERLLGRGGMAEVYEATQLGLGRRVAFKVMRTRLGEDDDFRQRFRREGQLQATLEHPHVVTVYEAGELDDGLFLAMRLVEGVTLKQLIVAGELDVERTLSILEPIADALDAAHGGGLVHRDVKPQNILVGDDDHPFLADFGLTRGQDQSGFTRSGQFVGTIDYISPEQVRGEPAGPASDVYAFSGVLFECLTGSVPYPRPSEVAVLYAHVKDEPPSARDVRGDLPPELDEVLAGGMAKEPEERPASAGDLIARARTTIEEDRALVGAPPPQASPLERGVRPVSGETDEGLPATMPIGERDGMGKGGMRRWQVGGLVAVGLAILAGVAFAGGRSAGGDDAPELSTTVASSAVSIRAPVDWNATSAGERPAVPGLTLGAAVGVAPVERDASGVMAGLTEARGASLLPASLRERVQGDLPAPDPIRLGELEALRYRDLRILGFDRGLTLFTVPSTAGVATVACYVPSAEAAAMEAVCDSVAQTLDLLRGRAFPLATEASVERELRRIAANLDRENVAGRRELARAGEATDQAASASALERVYGAAAARMRELEVSPALAAGVGSAAGAMDEVAAAYGDLAAAIEAGDAAAYETAVDSVRSAEKQMDRSLAAIDRAKQASGDGS